MSRSVRALALPGLVVLLWWIAGRAALLNAYLLPSPEKVWQAAGEMLRNGLLFRNVMASLWRVAIGFSLSFVAAFALGLWSGWRGGDGWFSSISEFFRHVPPLSLVPLLILWLGIGEASKIVIIVLASFFPMFLSVKKGIESCEQELLDVGRSFDFSSWQLLSRIALPHALPDVLLGARVGLGYSWRAIIGAEMIAAASGLGYLILDSQQMSRSDRVIVGILAIGLIGLVCDRIFSWLIGRLLPQESGHGWD